MSAPVTALACEPSVPSVVNYVVADRDDDVTTIHQKLADFAGQRVAIVLNPKSDAFDSPIAVHLLARIADQEAIALAVVTQRGRTRYWAEAEGITTFSKLSQVPREVLPDDDFSDPLHGLIYRGVGALRQSTSWLIALILLIALVALAIIVIPRAVVRVRPVTTEINATIPVAASINTTAPDAAKSLVPGRMLYLLVNTHGQTPVTHAGNQLDGHAIGYVTFENRSSEQQTVPAGTVVSTFSGLNFRTVKQVVLDPRPGASAQTIVRADYAGPGSDVRRGEVTVIQGRLHWFATVVNEDDITGGGGAGEPIVTGLDTSKLLTEVTADAEQQARQELASQTGAGEIAVPETIKVTPIEENFNHRPGDAASELAVNAQFRVSALIVNQVQIKQVALQNWKPQIQPGFLLRGDSVQLGSPVVTKVDEQGASFSVPIQALTYKSINTARLAQYVRLRSPSAAEKDISREFDLASPPSISIVPNWIGRAYRVDIVEDTSTSPSNAIGASP